MGSIGIESLEEKKPRFWEPKFLKNANLIENLIISLVCCSGKSERRVKVFCFLVFSVQRKLYIIKEHYFCQYLLESLTEPKSHPLVIPQHTLEWEVVETGASFMGQWFGFKSSSSLTVVVPAMVYSRYITYSM